MARDDTTCRLKRPVYLVDGARSPFLKARGRPGPFHAADLAARTAIPLLLRQPFEPGALDEVILGCVMPGPDEANIARVVALRIGCGERVPAFTVQRNCASGLQALDTAARHIADGCADLVLAGGVEAMSHAPLLFGAAFAAWLGQWRRARTLPARLQALARLRLSALAPVIGLLRGLTDPVVGLSMGQTAENLATRFDIRRRDMDAFAMRSHHRLATAQHTGRFDGEIVLLADTEGKAHFLDDGVRPDTHLEALAKLPPAFDRPFGRVTAGNSAQITDGAAWLVLASEEAVARYDLRPLARVLDTQWAGLDPAQMGLGPVHAMAPILARHGLDSPDIDYWEINEAFAAQVLACLRAWQDPAYCREVLGLERAFSPIDEARLNVDGGAIAIGHPVGASGARIVLHLARVLAREGGRLGMASLCIGGGQGGAMLIESTQERQA
ncbi:MAG: acetyl-CoA C-acetyltransferase [Gammaproteobacteria bacterium]|nr:MAG: acetyl-CoA C-acetyltransferase [Gammaproteobacteria bacterium]